MNIKKVILVALITLTIFIPTVANADMLKVNNIQDYSYVKSMQSAQGTGNYLGYTELKGFPQNEKYKIYYSGNSQSYLVKVDDFTVDYNKQVVWYYKGAKHVNTVQQCYSFFANTAVFRNYYGISDNFLSDAWFTNTFGQTFTDWQNYLIFTDEANRIVQKYLENKEGIVYYDRYSLANFDLSQYFENDNSYDLDGIN